MESNVRLVGKQVGGSVHSSVSVDGLAEARWILLSGEAGREPESDDEWELLLAREDVEEKESDLARLCMRAGISVSITSVA
jgi:hypothetical protein